MAFPYFSAVTAMDKTDLASSQVEAWIIKTRVFFCCASTKEYSRDRRTVQ